MHKRGRKRIVVLSGNHACHNPRAFKEAGALSSIGYDVIWLGGWIDNLLAQRDCDLIADKAWQFIPVIDWSNGSFRNQLSRKWQRARRRLGIKGYEKFHVENDWQLGYCTREMLRVAASLEADLYIAHSEPAMWVAGRLQQAGRRVGIDMEDWFSEDLPQESRKIRPVKLLRRLEWSLLRNSAYTLCTSFAMRDALVSAYDCPPPTVVYNTFPWTDRHCLDGLYLDRKQRDIPSIHWFSQTLGPGRGLEDLFDALSLIKGSVEIHLRGTLVGRFQQWMNSVIPEEWQNRIFLHPLVPNNELLSRIAEHDIGFAGEMKYSQSRDLTVTNKIMQYLLGGLAVVASDTSGQREIALKAENAVALYKSGDAAALARTINTLIEEPDRLAQAKKSAAQVAADLFSWEHDRSALLMAAEKALNLV